MHLLLLSIILLSGLLRDHIVPVYSQRQSLCANHTKKAILSVISNITDIIILHDIFLLLQLRQHRADTVGDDEIGTQIARDRRAVDEHELFAAIDFFETLFQFARLRKGKLNLEDFLEQMKQMKGMGSMEEIAGMIPGMNAQLKGATIDEKALARTEAIILSMTPQERANPDLLNFSRKKRIAAGCGQRVEDINRLLKQFEMTQKMVKQMAGMGKRMGKRKGGFKFPF